MGDGLVVGAGAGRCRARQGGASRRERDGSRQRDPLGRQWGRRGSQVDGRPRCVGVADQIQEPDRGGPVGDPSDDRHRVAVRRDVLDRGERGTGQFRARTRRRVEQTERVDPTGRHRHHDPAVIAERVAASTCDPTGLADLLARLATARDRGAGVVADALAGQPGRRRGTQVPPTVRIVAPPQPPVGRPLRQADRHGSVESECGTADRPAGDTAPVQHRSTVVVQFQAPDPDLGRVPRHVGVVPGEPGHRRGVGRHDGCRHEVTTAVLARGHQHPLRLVLPTHRDQLVARFGERNPVVVGSGTRVRRPSSRRRAGSSPRRSARPAGPGPEQ